MHTKIRTTEKRDRLTPVLPRAGYDVCIHFRSCFLVVFLL